MKLLALVLLAAACGPGVSRIGPYVKSVTRFHDTLVIERCMIVLRGQTLSESDCATHRIPLATTAPKS